MTIRRWAGAAGQQNRARNYYIARARQDLNIDTRTATEYGVVRTFFDATFNWTTGSDQIAGGSAAGQGFRSLGVYYAFIQFAGFTIGKAVSQYSTPWTGYPGNNTSFLIGGQDDVTGINQLAYTASFGNGVTGSISLEDAAGYDQSQLLSTSAGNGSAASWLAGTGTGTPAGTGTYGSFYGGAAAPDIVGQLRVDQAWGLFQASAAAHDVRASLLYPVAGDLGSSVGRLGLRRHAGVVDQEHPDRSRRHDQRGRLLRKRRVSLRDRWRQPEQLLDVRQLRPRWCLPERWVRGFCRRYLRTWWFDPEDGRLGPPWCLYPQLESHLVVVGVRRICCSRYNGAGKAIYCAGMGAVIAGQGVTYGCNPDFNIAQVGVVTRWTPVKNLTFSGEVMWTALDQKMSGVTGAAVTPAATKPTAFYEFKDQNTVTFNVRAQRMF